MFKYLMLIAIAMMLLFAIPALSEGHSDVQKHTSNDPNYIHHHEGYINNVVRVNINAGGWDEDTGTTYIWKIEVGDHYHVKIDSEPEEPDNAGEGEGSPVVTTPATTTGGGTQGVTPPTTTTDTISGGGSLKV